MAEQQFKRNVAYKYVIGQIMSGKPILENEKLKHVEINDKHIVRVNVVANIIDKYVQEGEKKYASITLDDASGNIKLKFFGDDVSKVENLSQGDTVVVIGLLRSWNNEVYITPEIIKKKEPQYLLIRKKEVEAEMPKSLDKSQLSALRDRLIDMIKEAEKDQGLDIDKAIMNLKEPPEIINKEIKKLLEDGLIYEPRPSKLRWLG
jgi:RecG-like helicase